MNMSGNILSSIKAAETGLARQQNRELEQIAKRFPADHPIREEYQRLTANLDGDLSSLPANHPFIMTLKDVKRQIEAVEHPEKAEQQEEEEHERSDERRRQRRAQQREQRIKEEEQRAIRRMASQQLNLQIAKVEKELDGLYMTVESVSDELSGDSYTRSKVVKLQRTMVAMKRALGECKVSSTRMM